MTTKTKPKIGVNGAESTKAKAQRVGIAQLVVLAAYEKTFSTGKTGFFGQVLDPATGQKYQIIGAVKVGV